MSAVARPAVETLVSVLKRRATEQPDRLAYVFVSEGAGEDRLTYGELDRKAKAIAHSLQGVAARGDCALLLYPAGLDFLAAFLGCLYAGVIAIPLFAPRPNREDPRLNAIIADSGARLALTVSNALPDRSSRGSRWTRLEYMFTDRIDSALGDHWRDSSVSKDELAYLQYTSGSTSDPKGVMVTHDNLLYNCSLMQECLGLSENTVSVTWLPHFHDMGLIDGLLNPLHVGYPAIVMSPTQFVARPVRWLRLISRFKATHSGGPNFAYDLCAKKIGVEERSELDLSSWTMAYSGSEPVRSETLDRFADYFAPCGFRRQSLYPSYGLAEATLMVSGGRHFTGPSVKDVDVAHLERGVYHPANGGKSRRLVACGSVRRATGLAIVDPATLTVCEDGKVGEIWVSGPTRARGYWKQPEKSSETFEAFIADTQTGPFLRTGDLGFLHGDELFVTGRLKDLIIVNGANYYPQDIEAVAEKAHPALRHDFGAAFSVDAEGRECLVIQYEVDRHHRNASDAEFKEIADAIRTAIHQEFELEVYAVQLLKVGGIQKTSSGKIQRQLCRGDFLAGTSDVLFESKLRRELDGSLDEMDGLNRAELFALKPSERGAALQERLRMHVARVLRMPWRQIDPTEPLGSYGLESLQGSQLIADIEDSLGVILPSTTIFDYPSVAELSRFLGRLMDLTGETETVSTNHENGRRKGSVEHHGLAEFLGAVEQVSVSEMQEMISKQTGEKRRRDTGLTD